MFPMEAYPITVNISKKKIDYLLSEEVSDKPHHAKLHCLDFEEFLQGLNLTSDDFIFLDPPYDTDFSTYSQNTFGPDEQIRLCECLKHTKAQVLMVVKYEASGIIVGNPPASLA